MAYERAVRRICAVTRFDLRHHLAHEGVEEARRATEPEREGREQEALGRAAIRRREIAGAPGHDRAEVVGWIADAHDDGRWKVASSQVTGGRQPGRSGRRGQEVEGRVEHIDDRQRIGPRGRS